ncbi:hypothetical protein AAC387_Pa03g2576 [Persea americana]
MSKLMQRMERKQIITHLLLTFLLLSATAHYHNFISIMVQARESDNVKRGIKGLESQAVAPQELSTWKIKHEIEANKARKVPSGPSPIGNHHPPVKP